MRLRVRRTSNEVNDNVSCIVHPKAQLKMGCHREACILQTLEYGARPTPASDIGFLHAVYDSCPTEIGLSPATRCNSLRSRKKILSTASTTTTVLIILFTQILHRREASASFSNTASLNAAHE